MLPYVLAQRGRRACRRAGRRSSCATSSRGFWLSPRRHPDFGWAWLTRFLINLGNALGTLYLLYYLQDAVARTPTPRPAY